MVFVFGFVRGRGSEIRRLRIVTAALSAALAAPVLAASPPLDDDSVRLPTLNDDQFSVPQGAPKTLDVLANDSNVLPQSTISLLDQPSCGSTKLDAAQRAILFDPAGCSLGATVVLRYLVRQGSALQAEVRIVVVAPESQVPQVSQDTSFACDAPDSRLRMIPIRGGRFVKNEAPEIIRDIADQLDVAEFELRDFCITEQPVSLALAEQYAPGARANGPKDGQRITGATTQSFAYGVSLGVANQIASSLSSATKTEIMVPSLNEYIAAAWRLANISGSSADLAAPKIHPAFKVPMYILALRSPVRFLTATPAPSGGQDAHWILGGPFAGPGASEGSFIKRGWPAAAPFWASTTMLVVRNRN